MDIVWVSMTAGGNLPPQLALCEALAAHGHAVHAVVDARAPDRVEAIAATVTRIEAPVPPQELPRDGIEGWVHSELFLGPRYSAALEAAIGAHRPERVLVDAFMCDAQVSALASGVPYAVIGHTLVATLWGGEGRHRVDEAHLDAHNRRRRDVGLEPVETLRDTMLDAHWFLAMTYDVLDAPDARAWPERHYVGAHVPAWTPSGMVLPEGDGPLVVVGFSTTPMGQRAIVQRVVDALGELPVRVLVTTGPALAAGAIDLPENATAVEFVPHDELLPIASLLVSHVGHGTMAAAARHGVPILAVPMGRDQDRNAEILERHGVGRWLPPTSDVADLRAAAAALLDDEDVRTASANLATRIRAHPDLGHAVGLLESDPPVGSADAPT